MGSGVICKGLSKKPTTRSKRNRNSLQPGTVKKQTSSSRFNGKKNPPRKAIHPQPYTLNPRSLVFTG